MSIKTGVAVSNYTDEQFKAELLKVRNGRSWKVIEEALGVHRAAVGKWVSKSSMPRTEYTGETNYVDKILDMNPAINRDILLRKRG